MSADEGKQCVLCGEAFEGPGNNDGECCDACQACVVCGEGFDGYGNNAQPLADGKCCDGCNGQVIQARVKEHQEAKAAAALERKMAAFFTDVSTS